MAENKKRVPFAVQIVLAVLIIGLLVFFVTRVSGPAAQFEAIQYGMSKKEVLTKLGEPDHISNDLDENVVYFYGAFSKGRWVTLKLTVDSRDIVIDMLNDKSLN